MKIEARKVISNSKTAYSDKHVEILKRLIDEKILLFCAAGTDCEIWHDVMGELFVGFGEKRDFFYDYNLAH